MWREAALIKLGPCGIRSSVYDGEVELVRHLVAWAEAKQLRWVDGIATLDDDRSVLSSWVHLSPKRNLGLAHAFADIEDPEETRDE